MWLDEQTDSSAKSLEHGGLFLERRRRRRQAISFSYSISPAERLAFITTAGSFDLGAAMGSMGSVGKDPQSGPDSGVLVDARAMEYRPTVGEIGVLAWALGHEKINYRSKLAVIRSSPGLQAAGAVRTRLAERTGMAFGLFSDRESALRWVGGS